jgi:hypothetical protein
MTGPPHHSTSGVPIVAGTMETYVLVQGDDRSALAKALLSAFGKACAGQSKLPARIRAMRGMSGQRYRMTINNVVESLDDARYLEVGSWIGSTACAALYGNRAKCLCIDNWSKFGGTRERFLKNFEMVKSDHIRLTLIEQDFRSVDYLSVGLYNVYLFDGPHEDQAQYDGIVLAQSALDNEHILIVDDWNWHAVRNGTRRALADLKSHITFAIEVRTTRDDSLPRIQEERSKWHNGYFLAVVSKARERGSAG